MREQLISYVELLFAGSSGCEDMKQEILQNTLERYDDLIGQGKAPQAAYRLAIAGIGDISELLSPAAASAEPPVAAAPAPSAPPRPGLSLPRRILRAIAVMLYILCPIPLLVLAQFGMEMVGLSGMLAMIAVATAIFTLSGSTGRSKVQEAPADPLYKSIRALIATLSVIVYLALSIHSGAWYITWVIFPLAGALTGLFRAILDLKGAEK